jgi:endonuclease-3
LQGNEIKKLGTKVRRITSLLERVYGIPRRERKADPLEVLIQTILSQNTNDRNRDLAYERLRTRFPHWGDIPRAKKGEIARAIRPGGLANQKAKRIRDLLQWIKDQQGGFGLLSLRKMGSEEIEETLGALKGIGPKTLACLLLFGLGREAFPVDTHILRIGRRLGFIPERLDAEKAHSWMVPLVPKGKSLSLHLNLIRFGRSICKARHPKCDSCFLRRECFFDCGLRNTDCGIKMNMD